jgi:type IV secretory pathway TrbF-like protein
VSWLLAAGMWSGRTEAVQLHALVWLAVIVNALFIGMVHVAHSRFGARIGWLIPLSVLLSLSGSSMRAAPPQHGAEQ